MKRCKLLVLLILICLLMLPAFATAETQEEFELRCFKKTAAAATVYSYLNSSEGEVIDYIPAGTYVQCKSSTRDGRTTVVYMKNGVKKQGTIKVKLIDCTSTIRKSDGLAYDIHEKDPNYDAKIKEGVLEFDVTKYSDSSAYYLYRAGAGPEPERKDGSNAVESQNASQTDTQASNSGTSVGIVELGRTSSKIQYLSLIHI